VQLLPALTVTKGLFERRFADRTIDVQGNWASGLQAVVAVPVLLNHFHDKLRTVAFFHFRLT
jgi:hypothetical protein